MNNDNLQNMRNDDPKIGREDAINLLNKSMADFNESIRNSNVALERHPLYSHGQDVKFRRSFHIKKPCVPLDVVPVVPVVPLTTFLPRSREPYQLFLRQEAKNDAILKASSGVQKTKLALEKAVEALEKAELDLENAKEALEKAKTVLKNAQVSFSRQEAILSKLLQ